MRESTLEEFTGALASPAPVPGGGGASALAGALAVSLGDMVGEFTVGKKKYADVEPEIKALMARAQQLRSDLLDCIGEDARAFEPLSKAYGIPKEDPQREAVLEKCLRDAAAAPLKILELCCEAVELLRDFGEKGSRLMVSDAATGAALCRGAMLGAAVNVRVNTKLMKDRAYAAGINSRVEELTGRYVPMADGIFTEIYGRFADG